MRKSQTTGARQFFAPLIATLMLALSLVVVSGQTIAADAAATNNCQGSSNPAEGWIKIDNAAGSVSGAFGSLNYNGTGASKTTVFYTLNAGFTLELCIKAGNADYPSPIITGPVASGQFSTNESNGISHVAYRVRVIIPAAPSSNDPCGLNNATWNLPADTAAIDWNLAAGVLTATAQDPYFFTNGTKVKTFGTALDSNTLCVVTVTPVNPTMTQDQCVGGQATGFNVILPPVGGNITYAYNQNTRVVTATATNGTQFASTLPTGWTRVNDTTAAYQVTRVDAGDCRIVTEPVSPTVAQDQCVDGQATGFDVALPQNGNGITYSYNSNTLVVTATAGQNYRLAQNLPTGWVRVSDTSAIYQVTRVDAGDCRGVVTPVDPTVTQDQCVDGQATGFNVTLAPNASGVSYTYDTVEMLVTATAGANKRFADPLPDGWTPVDDDSATYQVTRLDAGDCRIVTEPVSPTVAQDQCVSGQATGFSVTLPQDGDGATYAYNAVSMVVTATADQNYQFAQNLRQGWSRDSDTTATYQVTQVPAGDCRIVVEPTAPIVAQDRCVDGQVTGFSVTLPQNSADVTYSYDGATKIVTATAGTDRKFAQNPPAGWTRVDDDTATYQVTKVEAGDCRGLVTPVDPTVTPDQCVDGQPTGFNVTLPPNADGVSYSYNADTLVVTATAGANKKFTDTLPEGWTRVDDDTATYQVTKVDAGDCRGIATPVAPTVTQDQCVNGQATGFSVTTAPDSADVSYTYNSQTMVVTATAGENRKFADNLPVGWTRVNDTTATYQVTKVDPGDCALPPPGCPDGEMDWNGDLPGCGNPPTPPTPVQLTENTEGCSLVSIGFPETAGTAVRTGVQEYILMGMQYVLEPLSGVEWGAWAATEYTDQQYFEECASGQPDPIVREVAGVQTNCDTNGTTYTVQTFTTEYVWNTETRAWELGAETGPEITEEFIPFGGDLPEECVEEPEEPEVEGEQAQVIHHQLPADVELVVEVEVKGEQVVVPTAVDAGIGVEESPLGSGRNPLWLLAVGGGLGLMGSAGLRRRATANR